MMEGGARRAAPMWRDELAIKPNDGESFLREVDEELRKDRANQFVSRYGWLIVGAIVLLLAAIAGWIWWQARSEEQNAARGEALLEALESMEKGNRAAALPKINEVAESGSEGYRAAALFTRASAELEAGNDAAAAATLGSIAGDEDFAEPYRHAALVRQTALQFDSLQPRAVIQRLGPLARPGNAWFGSAGEMVAVAHLKMRRPDLAGPLFAQIARDENVPPSIRSRAVQMAGSLGIDATQEPAAPGAAPPAAPAGAPATKEEAE